jgi:hypothetical protein
MASSFRTTTWMLALGLVLLIGCGRPGDEDGDDGSTPPPTTRVDKTPLNTELDLGFDGEVPDMAIGKDGTVHLLYRVVQAPKATLYYTRKDPFDNIWTQPMEVPGSGNAAYRWFAWPDLAVGPDGRVHIVWMPEPSGRSGMFYTSCLACDGTDWRGRNDGQGNRFSRLTDDLVEFAEICATQSGAVYILATQLDRMNSDGRREQDDQMVVYPSLNAGENWEPNYYITKPQAYEDLSMQCVGDDVHVMMRFKQTVYARYIPDGTGGRSWVIAPNIPHAGPNTSEINFFVNKDGLLTGYIYSIWEYRDPLGIAYTKLGGAEAATTVLTPELNFRLRVNNLIGGENSRGQRVAVWADFHGYFHYNQFDGNAWTGDQPFTNVITPLSSANGLAQGGIYAYAPGHGWQGRILWPITAMGEYNGAFHLVFRAITESTENGTTKRGRFHYVKYQPFEPTNDHTVN